MACQSLEWASREAGGVAKRLVILGDNVAVNAAMARGRSSSRALRIWCRRAAAYEIIQDWHVY